MRMLRDAHGGELEKRPISLIDPVTIFVWVYLLPATDSCTGSISDISKLFLAAKVIPNIMIKNIALASCLGILYQHSYGYANFGAGVEHLTAFTLPIARILISPEIKYVY